MSTIDPSGVATSPVPAVSVSLSISPATHDLQEATLPTLSITASLEADRPITVCTWPTILNPRLALKRTNFWAEDLSTEPPTTINLEITKGPRRAGFQRRRGHPDEQYYLTLQPQTPVTISHPFTVMNRLARHDAETRPSEGDERESGSATRPARRVRFGVAPGQGIDKWWWGTMDEVLAPEDGTLLEVEPTEGEDPITFGEVAAIELEISGATNEMNESLEP